MPNVAPNPNVSAASSFPAQHMGAGTGFADQNHFTRAFRKITGMTPAAFRSALSRAS